MENHGLGKFSESRVDVAIMEFDSINLTMDQETIEKREHIQRVRSGCIKQGLKVINRYELGSESTKESMQVALEVAELASKQSKHNKLSPNE